MTTPSRLVGLLACLFFVGCGSDNGAPTSPSGTGSTSSTSTPAPTTVSGALQVLATRSIYFGHQSVGGNIVSGVQTLITANPGSSVRVVSSSSASALAAGVFAHGSNGSNGDPAGKNDAFDATIRGGVGAAVDIAFFKYCYVDIYKGADAARLFDDYRAHMAALRAAYPRVRFVHVTAPLTTSGTADNEVRERFNSLMRQAYAGSEPLFDLAGIESTAADGSTVLAGGVRALAPAYSSDGGHLNATGQEVVAKALLLYLASL
jgi:hypothetical protein